MEEYKGATNNARFFMILFRPREFKKVSYGHKITKKKLFEVTILSLQHFMSKDDSMNNTVTEIDLQRDFNHPIYPRDSKIYSIKGFVNITDGSKGGSHWICFHKKDNTSF